MSGRSGQRPLSESLRCAVRGLGVAWRQQRNFRLYVAASLAVIALGWWARVSRIEWIVLSLAIGLVWVAELLNTAIEWMVDLVVGDSEHRMARQIKDVAAGAVLVIAIVAVLIGLGVFVG